MKYKLDLLEESVFCLACCSKGQSIPEGHLSKREQVGASCRFGCILGQF